MAAKAKGEPDGTVESVTDRALGRPPDYTVDQVREALDKAGGVYSVAADKLGCARQTVANYVARHTELAEAVAEIKHQMIDIAEASLMTQMRSGNMTAIIFYLKTQGKDRGYSQRQEFTGAGGGPLRVERTQRADLSKLSGDELDVLEGLLQKAAEDEDGGEDPDSDPDP